MQVFMPPARYWALTRVQPDCSHFRTQARQTREMHPGLVNICSFQMVAVFGWSRVVFFSKCLHLQFRADADYKSRREFSGRNAGPDSEGKVVRSTGWSEAGQRVWRGNLRLGLAFCLIQIPDMRSMRSLRSCAIIAGLLIL